MDPTTQSSSSMGMLERLRTSSHPIATLTYLFFRLSPIALYLCGRLLTANFNLLFISGALLVSADFWNVKNVAGRRLVRLRWWNETTPDGESVWVFENADPSCVINPIDSQCFWLFLYAVPVAWAVFGFMAILKFHFLWLIFVAFALTLTTINALAFSRCDKFSRANSVLGNVQGNIATRLASSFWSSISSRFTRS